jgi:hypothetical protein
MHERDKNPVVAVCGNEAMVYGDQHEKTGIRPLRRVEVFTNYGQALEFAREYETPKEKKKK